MSKKDLQRFKKGSNLFKKIQNRFIRRHKGKIIAIEPDSGRYFIGDGELETAQLALAEFPNKIFSFFRIGYPVVHKFRSQNAYAKRVR